MVAQGARVRLDPGLELRARAVLHALDLVAVVAVQHEHGQQPADVRRGRDGAAEVEALGVRLLREDGHVVALAAPFARQLAGVDVRARATEEVAVPDEDPHQRELGQVSAATRGDRNRCGRAGSFSAVRILYGVNGEGMGHATRSQVVIDALLAGARRARDGVGRRIRVPRAAARPRERDLRALVRDGPRRDPTLGDREAHDDGGQPRASRERQALDGRGGRVAPGGRGHRLRAARGDLRALSRTSRSFASTTST